MARKRCKPGREADSSSICTRSGLRVGLRASISATTHPVGWEEISARKQQVIDAAVALLQESYQYTVTRRGSEMTEYMLCAPVLMAGEDVPVVSLTGKIVRASLRVKGELIPDDLPRFPVPGEQTEEAVRPLLAARAA